MDNQFNDLSEPDPDVEYYCSELYQSSGFTPLMKYVLMVRQHPEVIPLIEKIVTDIDIVNKQNNRGWTALMIACTNYLTYSNGLVIKMLIDAGANTNIENAYGTTALTIASYDRNIEVVKILIDAGANLNITDVQSATALMLAVKFSASDDNIETLKMLISAGADVNKQTSTGMSILMVACGCSNNIETIKLLIDAGANINSVTDTRINALMVACACSNNVEILKLLMLLSRNILLDVDTENKTAYDHYVKFGNDILDEYHLRILRGDINSNMTKSARFC